MMSTNIEMIFQFQELWLVWSVIIKQLECDIFCWEMSHSANQNKSLKIWIWYLLISFECCVENQWKHINN